jgi:hypothetical protein
MRKEFEKDKSAKPSKVQRGQDEPKNAKYVRTTTDEDKDPCWDSHKMVGTKKKGGKTVPNCVPK